MKSISSITLTDGNQYALYDERARELIEELKEKLSHAYIRKITNRIKGNAAVDISITIAGVSYTIKEGDFNFEYPGSAPTTLGSLFKDKTGLNSITRFDIDTSKVTNIGSMFRGCSGLTSLDLSDFDGQNVTYMSFLFRDCKSLKSINVSGMDVSHAGSFGDVFRNCASLPSVDVSTWRTSRLNYLGYTFSGCANLASLDLSSWDTDKVTNISGMLYGCAKLKKIDLTGCDFSAVITTTNCFKECSSLTEIAGGLHGLKVSISLADCPLTYEGAKVLVSSLADLTGGDAQTITLSSTTKSLDVDSEIGKMAANKNWTIA